MSDQTIQRLVRAFQSGSRDAFAELVGLYQNLVTSVAFANTGDLQRSEDIAQQTFLVAWQKQDQLNDPERFAAWLRSIARNLAHNERRLKENVTQKKSVPVSDQLSSETEIAPDQQASKAEQSALLWSSLDRIPVEYREPLVLYYREDHSVAAVAQQLGLSTDAVKQRLKRGRDMLKIEIESMVEKVLLESRPTRSFSSGVMSALPVVGAAVGSHAAKTGAAVSAKVVGGKVGAAAAGSLTIAGLVTLVGAFLGLSAGILAAWFSVKSQMQRATSNEEKTVHWSFFVHVSIAVTAFVTGWIMAGQFEDQRMRQWICVGFLFPVGMNLLVVAMLRQRLRLRRLHRIHGRPEHLKGITDNSTLVPKSTSTAFARGMGGLLTGIWIWLVIVLGIGSLKSPASLAMCVISIAIAAVLIRMQAIKAEALETAAAQLRYAAEVVWNSSLIQAGFILATILVAGSEVLGESFTFLFSNGLSHNGVEPLSSESPASPQDVARDTARLAAWLLVPGVIVIGGIISWIVSAKARVAEDELELDREYPVKNRGENQRIEKS